VSGYGQFLVAAAGTFLPDVTPDDANRRFGLRTTAIGQLGRFPKLCHAQNRLGSRPLGPAWGYVRPSSRLAPPVVTLREETADGVG
jgi:hypothetical protein